MPKTKRIMLPTQEDIKTEFKQSFTDDVIIALVAFANAKGGKVYVGMPDGITIEQLRHNNYVSKPYNKQVAKIFKEMGEIERFGTGVKRVCDMFIDYGLPKPEWILTADGLVVKVFATPSTEDVTENVTENVTEIPIGGAVKGDTENVTENVTGNVTENEGFLIAEIKANPDITTEELAMKLNVTRRTVQRYLDKLKQQGLIVRIGPDKGGHWKVTEQVANK